MPARRVCSAPYKPMLDVTSEHFDHHSAAVTHGTLQVPMDQAKNALDMITRFTRGEDFGSRDSTKLVTATSRQEETVSAA